MASSVQIELILDPSGAVSGVRAFETQLKGMGTTAKAAGDQVQRAFAPPPLRWTQVHRDIDEVGKHALTSLDNVRLLRDDLGIRIPRSMEKAIASSKVLSAAIKGIGFGLLAFGAIEIGFSVAKGAYDGLHKLWEEHLSLTKAAQDYELEVQKTREEAFGNTDSIEDTTLRIDVATEAVKRYREEADKAASQPGISWRSVIPLGGAVWESFHQQSTAHDLMGKAVGSQRQLDILNRETETKQYHDERERSIEWEHAKDDELVGQKKIDASQQEAAERAFEKRRFGVDMQKANSVESYGADGKIIPANPIDPNAGASEESDANGIARRKAQAETFLLQKRQSEELTHMRQQALEAGLRGTALYEAQEAAAIADLKFKDMDSTAARNAIHLRFHNEEMKRLEDQQRETRKIQDETKLGGLTGIAHVQMQGQARVNEVVSDPALDPVERDKRVAAIEGQTAAEVAAKQLEWTQKVDEVVAQSQDKQVSGFARIRAEADKTKGDLQRQFDEAHANMDLAKPGQQGIYDTDVAQLGRGLSSIDRGSDYQQAQLAQRNAQETEQIEGEAQRKSMSALKQETAAINSEYKDRVRKYQEQLNQQEISQDDFNRRVAAAAEERNAEMVEASNAAREKMAGQFDSLFKSLNHPAKALEGLGEKVAGEAAARLVQQLQQRAGKSTADGPQKGGVAGTFLGILQGFGFGEKTAQPGTRGPGATTGTVPASSPAPLPSLWPWHHHSATQPASAPPTGSISAPVVGRPQIARPEAAPAANAYDIGSATIRIGSASITISGAQAQGNSTGSVGGGSTSTVRNFTTNVGGNTSDAASPSARTAGTDARPGFAGGSTTLLGSPVTSDASPAHSVYAGSPSASTSTASRGFSVYPPSALRTSSREESDSAGSTVASKGGAGSGFASRANTAVGIGTSVAAGVSPRQGGVVNDISQGFELYKQAKATFGRPRAGAQTAQQTRAGQAHAASQAAGTGSRPVTPSSVATPSPAPVASGSSISSQASPVAPAQFPRASESDRGAVTATQGTSVSASGAVGGTGAGSAGGAGASTVGQSGSFAGAVGPPKQTPSVMGKVQDDVSKGFAIEKQATAEFGGGSGATPGTAANGSAGAPAGPNPGMLAGGGVQSNAEGAVTGALGMYSAVKGDGGIGGALQGGMAGMQLGAALGGPMGAAIGLVGGAVIGAIGFGGKEQARVYDLKTVRPKITGDTDSFQQGSMDYTAAFSDLQATDWQARSATGQMGPQGHAYYEDYIAKEMKTAEAKLTQEQKAGRSMYTASAASYDIGTDSVPHDGIAMIHKHERIMPSDKNERITRAVESHASMSATHASYQSAMRAKDARSNSQGVDRTLNMHVHAIDAKGTAQFLDKNKHLIRAAVNNASSENSGGGLA